MQIESNIKVDRVICFWQWFHVCFVSYIYLGFLLCHIHTTQQHNVSELPVFVFSPMLFHLKTTIDGIRNFVLCVCDNGDSPIRFSWQNLPQIEFQQNCSVALYFLVTDKLSISVKLTDSQSSLSEQRQSLHNFWNLHRDKDSCFSVSVVWFVTPCS